MDGRGSETCGRVSAVRGLSSLASLGLFLAILSGCGPQEDGTVEHGGGAMDQTRPVSLGPTDGRDLPATELDRVAVGTLAPDFSLLSLAGDTVSLSSYHGSRNVVLVFYRGHW